MTQDEKHAAALSDLDDQPITEDKWKRMKRVPRLKTLRRALGLSQSEFAAQFRIPIGMLSDWEEGCAAPDPVLRAYLKVIATAPDMVRKALAPDS